MSARALALGVALAFSVTVFVVARRYRPDDAPFRPTADSEVLEQLARGSGRDPATDETRALEAALAKAPNDLTLAGRVVRQHVTAAKRTGDARRLSYAEAALAPWWSLPTPPPSALLWRAVIRQSRHEFVPALADLDRALALVPGDEQALLTRASILDVLARYDEARASCAGLVEHGDPLVVSACKLGVEAVHGGGDERDRLTALMAAPTVGPEALRWASEVRGEAYLYAGETQAAEADLRVAMMDGDAYPRALLADLLLDDDRALAVLDLIASDEPNEVLLLRRAIAAKRLGTPDAATLRAALSRSHDELVARGDASHQREEARRLLVLEERADDALTAALESFAQQREPWDARLVIEAALAVPGRAAEATPALAWLERSHCTWPVLVRLALALRQATR